MSLYQTGPTMVLQRHSVTDTTRYLLYCWTRKKHNMKDSNINNTAIHTCASCEQKTPTSFEITF